MFTKLVILTTLSLVSIVTAMTPEDIENNSNQLVVVAAGAAIEQVGQAAEEHAAAIGQILTATPAATRVYKEPHLWSEIRSYLGMNYSCPSDARISKLLALNESDRHKAFIFSASIFSPYLKINDFSILSNAHLIALSTNTFFDTVDIDMPYINPNNLADGLATLKTSLLPRKVTISSESFQTIRWTRTFETINGKRVNTRTSDFVQITPERPSHSCGMRIRGGELDGNAVWIEEPECGRDICVNQIDIFSKLQVCANIKKTELKSFWEKETDHFSSIRDLILMPQTEYKFFKITNEFSKIDLSAILLTLPTLALESSSIEPSYARIETTSIPVESSAGEIYLKLTTKFSVFSLKK
ncbi:MAG: hypothetical protein V4544_06355 [Pseudomonadota bacterium]